jgi:hypothetical protein
MTALATSLAVAAALGAALSAQAPAASGTLAVSGAVKTPLTLTKADLQSMARTSVTLDDHGKKQVYEGVLVAGSLTESWCWDSRRQMRFDG